MSCNCWTDNEATEVDCSRRGVFSISLPSSSFIDVNLWPWLDSPRSCISSLFIRFPIWRSLSSSTFVRRTTLYSISAIFSSIVEVLVIMTDTTSQDDEEESDLKWSHEISSFEFPFMGEKLCDQLLVKEEEDLPPCLRCSKVEMPLLMTLFLVRGFKEMIVWTLASLVDRAWSWLFALGWLWLIAPMQLLVVAVQL